MRSILTAAILVFGLIQPHHPGAEGKPCPFEEMGDKVLLALSSASWNDTWKSIRAPQLGDQILEGIREDLLPAILKETQVENESATMEAKVAELVESVDWKSLAGTPFSLTIWTDDSGLPKVTFRAHTREGETGNVHEAFKSLLTVMADWFEEIQVRDEGDQTLLSFALEGEQSDWIFLESSEQSVWITFSHTLEQAREGQGLSQRPGFSDLWAKGPDSVDTALVIDFRAVSEWIVQSMDAVESDEFSSLVLDETMEALFKEDQETLEKLKKVESDMDFLTGKEGEDFEEPMRGLLEDLGSLGLLVAMSGSTTEGIDSSTYWRLESGSPLEEILNSPPLSERFLSMIQPDLLRGSAYSIPDLLEVYRFLLDRTKGFPGGGDLLQAWDEIQGSISFDLEEDLFPAFGNEFALLTRRSDQASFAGFRLVNNESYVIVETREAAKVEKLLARLDDILRTYQLTPTRANIGDVTFTQLVAGLMGEAAWGWDPDLGVLVVTTNPRSNSLPGVIEEIRNPKGFSFEDHPRWETLKSIWKETPSAVVYDNLAITWQQQVDELKGAKMMLSMLGGGDPITLGVISLAMEILSGIPSPDAYLRVDSEDSFEKVSKSLLLFPEELGGDHHEEP